jgi:hypothetical protein
MEIEKNCPICCSNYTDVLRKSIECNSCNFSMCVKCIKTYLLGTIKDPHCMNCSNGWTREFIDNSLSKAFRTNELKKHREDILVDREKSMLLATMPLVEIEINKRNIKDEIDVLHLERHAISNKIKEIDDEINMKIHKLNINKPSTVDITKVYQRQCPNNECRGFLCNWKCSLCNVKVCLHCHCIKEDDDHVCNDNDIATAKLILKDTKYCPNESCRVPIFKIAGCSQMFCTKCHTSFDWRTCEIITNQETIHNPHFYAWVREKNNGQIPRNPLDVCGGLPTIWNIIDFLKRKNLKLDISKYHRGIQHILYHEIPGHPVNLVGGDIFTSLRIKYIMKSLSFDDWKRELQRIEKKNEKNIAFRYIFEMFTNVGIDIFNQIIIKDTKDEIVSLTNELDTLRKYFNENIYKLYKRFDSKPKEIDTDWVFNNIIIPTKK